MQNSESLFEVLINNLVANIDEINRLFSDCPDVVRRPIKLRNNTEGYIIYTEDIIDTDLLQRDLIKILLAQDIDTDSVDSVLSVLP
ncbi:MAG: hypothetical protein ACOZCL_06915 [Bacillota bacterium]